MGGESQGNINEGSAVVQIISGFRDEEKVFENVYGVRWAEFDDSIIISDKKDRDPNMVPILDLQKVGL